jgi:predicted nucleic acid-binding protein
MRQKIYLETSVVSYFVSRPSKNIVIAGRQAVTKDMWAIMGYYDVFISDIVIQESSRGDTTLAKLRLDAVEEFNILKIDDEAKELAKLLIQRKAIPDQYPEDALHISIAAVNGIDVVATWNFKHLNNPFTRTRVRKAIEQEGYTCPEICSPDEFLGDEI